MKKMSVAVALLAASFAVTGCVRTKTVPLCPPALSAGSDAARGLKNPGLPAGANLGDGGRTFCGTRNEVGADTFPLFCTTPPNYGDAFDVRNQVASVAPAPVTYVTTPAPAVADPVVTNAFVVPPAPTPRPALSASMGVSVGVPQPISY